jgi:hypothetical protein
MQTKQFLNLSVDRELKVVKSEIQIEKVLIDPGLATELLRGNVANRTLTSSKIIKYTQDIINGDWTADTAECIKLTSNMRLLDGQHRLSAIVASNTAVEMFVAYNVPESAMNNIDTGMSRSTKNIFELNGIQNAQTVSSVIKKYLAYKYFSFNDGVNDPVKQMQITNKQALDEYNSRQEFWHDLMNKFVKCRHTFKNIESTYIMSWYALCNDINTELTSVYFNTLTSGLGLTDSKDPIYVFRQFLLEKAETKNRSLNFALFVKSWNFNRKKQTVTVLRYNATVEKYPTLLS